MRKKDKEKYAFVGIYIILFIILGISLYCIFNPRKSSYGEIFKDRYDALEYNINVVKTNMDKITTSNDDWEWYRLKKVNTEDEELIDTYNLLVSDIRRCYLLSTDLKNKTYDNMKILSFKNKKSINNKQISQLEKNKNCLSSFGKYKSMVLSNNQELSNKIKNQINIMIDYKEGTTNAINGDISNEVRFMDFLDEETNKMSKIASLSSWLKIEYDSRK